MTKMYSFFIYILLNSRT